MSFDDRWQYEGRAEALCEYLRKNLEWLTDPEAGGLLRDAILHNFDRVFEAGARSVQERMGEMAETGNAIPVLDLAEVRAAAGQRLSDEECATLPPGWIDVAKG